MDTHDTLDDRARREAMALLTGITPGEWRVVHWKSRFGEEFFISTVDDTNEGVAAAMTVAKVEFPNRCTEDDFAFIAAAPTLLRRYEATLAALEADRDYWQRRYEQLVRDVQSGYAQPF